MPTLLAALPHAAPSAARRPSCSGVGGEREGAVGEDVDLGARIGADERARRADRLGQPVRQVVRAAPPRSRPARGRGRGSARAVTRGCTPDSITITSAPSREPPHERRPPPPSRARTATATTSRAFIDADVSRTTTTLRAPSPITVTVGRASASVSASSARIWRISSGSRCSRWKNADASRSRSARLPQEQARHASLAAAHLEEVEQHQRQREREEQEREGRQERHASTSPFSCASTNSSTGVSVITRWYPISCARQKPSARSRNACSRSR